MKTYLCVICGFVYEEDKGLPEFGISPGTSWAGVPPCWRCPDCGGSKDDLERVEG